MNPRVTSLLLAFCIAVISGCGGGVEKMDTFKVTGKVTYKGNPVEGAVVNFHPEKGPKASGTTDSSGVYSLTTYDTGDGAIAGEHKVTISKVTSSAGGEDDIDLDDPGEAYGSAMGGGEDGTGGEQIEQHLPEKYADLNSTPEKRNVAESANEFNFELTD